MSDSLFAIHRSASVAGRFYPADPGRLRAMVRGYLDASLVEPAPKRVVGLIAPHAGYPFSGPCAGHAYRRVEGKRPERVILLGVSHRHAFEGWSIADAGAYESPLGEFPIDHGFASRIEHLQPMAPTEPHEGDHTLEVHLPFLAEALGLIPIVPILFGSRPMPEHEHLGRALGDALGPDDLIVCSTDLSHFYTEAEANALDQQSLSAVSSKDCAAYREAVHAGRVLMCGATAVHVTMASALQQGAADWRLLDYRTSAKASGDASRVVGYGAMTLEKAPGT